MARKTLVLLDAHAIVHRAYHALPNFTTSRGEPTGGLYGLSTMLIKLVNEWRPDFLIACYDLPEKTFREQLYADYKAKRPKLEETLTRQLQRSRDIFAVFNIPIYDAAGFEADDVIGAIVEQTKTIPDLQVIIASGDTDTLQLVSGDRVVVYTFKKGISETAVFNEEAVGRRFGFAPGRLPDFKALCGDPSDNIVGVKGIGEKTASALISGFGGIEEIYQRLKADRDAFLAAGFKERVLKLLVEGEEEAFFSKTLATIRRDVPIRFVLPAKPWRETVDLQAVERLFDELQFKTLGRRLESVLAEGGGVAIPAETVEAEEVTDPPPELAVAAWLLNSELAAPTTTEILALSSSRTLEEAGGVLLAEIEKQNLGKVYREIELPLIPILRLAEERGVLIDVEHLKSLSRRYHRELRQIAERVFELVECRFNLNSPKQLAEVLFDRLHLSFKGLRKTTAGARSTRESELQKLQDKHPAIAGILDHRELQKLLSTYLDAMPPLLDRANRLHTQFRQTGTTTGRLASVNPNLQNIPVASKRGRAIRRAFVATPGFAWTTFDYSQIEMRVLAALSGDPELIKIFQAGEDVHTGVAARIFQIGEGEVTPEMRRRAKTVNFGIIYGMGVNSLRVLLHSSREEAEVFYEQFFLTFPRVRSYFEEVKQQARKVGYTTTFFGRRRYFPDIRSFIPRVRALNERMAMNAPIQGTAADVMKLAMIRAENLLRERKLRQSVHLLLTVHDELLYEIETPVLTAALPVLKRAMEEAVSWPVPLVVKIATGPNWAEMRE